MKLAPQKRFIAACILPMSFIAHAASFDCSQAKSQVEHLVCSDQRLSRLDQELTTVYQQHRERDGSKKVVVESQRSWLQSRNRCADLNCIDRHYVVRLAQLSRTTGTQYEVVQGKHSDFCQALALELNARLGRSPARVCAFEVISSMRGLSGPVNQLSIADNKDLYKRFKLPDLADAGQLSSNLESLLTRYDSELNSKWERAVQNGHRLFAANNTHTQPYLAVTEILPASEDRCPEAVSLLFTDDRKSIRFSESDVIASRLPITVNGHQYWIGQNLQSVQGVVLPVSDQVFFGTSRLVADACRIELSTNTKRN